MDLKVVLLGKEYGGKTSLVERYIHGKFNANAPYQSVSVFATVRGREHVHLHSVHVPTVTSKPGNATILIIIDPINCVNSEPYISACI